MQDKGRLIGIHFFNPVPVMKLIEVVMGPETSNTAYVATLEVAQRMNKETVKVRESPGFTTSRINALIGNESFRMLEAGVASASDIDKALKLGLNHPMGPFEMGDLAGLDIGFMTRQRKAATRDPRDVVPTWADEMYHNGWHGQKTGQGYYTYEGRKGTPNEAIVPLIEAARGDRLQQSWMPEMIQRRYMAAMVNEAAKVVGEGIAARPLDVDVTLLYGYGFPRWRGGPMLWADMEGLPGLLSDIQAWAKDDPYFWQPAPLLEQLVAEGRTFSDLNEAKS